MHMPDNEADYGDQESAPDDDGLEAEELEAEALVWQLLLLINPGDEESALRQFAHYSDALELAGPEAQPVWVLKDVIDWRSGFHVDWKDTASFVDAMTELVSRWNLDIDWGGDASEEEFLEATDVPALMATAYDRLREHGYTLWTWNTEGQGYAGWITSSRDDEPMRLLATALDIELHPGSDSF